MRYLVGLVLLLCLACHGRSGPPPSSQQSTDSGQEKVQARVEDGLDRLERRLAVRPQRSWSSLPYNEGQRLVVLVLEHQGQTARGEWLLSGQAEASPDNPFARKLETLPQAPTEAELLALVPRSWLPSETVAVEESEKPSKPEPPRASPTPELPPPPSEPPPPPKPKPKLALTGVMAGDIQTGFFQLGERTFSAKPGETVAGVTVHSIEPQKAVVTFRGKRREMWVSIPLDAQLRSPKPRPSEGPERVYLNNSDLDMTPPEVLPSGVRKL